MKSAWSGHGYRRLVIEYFTAVLLVAAAAILTWLLRHPFPDLPSSLFFCAVILSAWLGGLGPAFIASFLSSTTIILWLPWQVVVAPTVANEIPRFLIFLFASLFTLHFGYPTGKEALKLRFGRRMTSWSNGLKNEPAN